MRGSKLEREMEEGGDVGEEKARQKESELSPGSRSPLKSLWRRRVVL